MFLRRATHVTITITLNKIADNAIGIWLSKAVSAAGLRNNASSREREFTPISGRPLEPGSRKLGEQLEQGYKSGFLAELR